MKKIVFTLFFFLSLSATAEEKIEFFKNLSFSTIQPYTLEGLWPLLSPVSQEHYQFVFDEKHRLLRVAHFNEGGDLTAGEDGWAIFKLEYDEGGRLLETSFHHNNGSLTQSRHLGFARQVKGVYYSTKGTKLKNPRNNLGITPFENRPE